MPWTSVVVSGWAARVQLSWVPLTGQWSMVCMHQDSFLFIALDGTGEEGLGQVRVLDSFHPRLD